MNLIDMTADQYQALSVAACMGSSEDFEIIRALICDCENQGHSSDERSFRLSNIGAYQLLKKAQKIVYEAASRSALEAGPFIGDVTSSAVREMSDFAYERWGITDPAVSIRILHQVVLHKAQPAKLLAGLFYSLSVEDAKKDPK